MSRRISTALLGTCLLGVCLLAAPVHAEPVDEEVGIGVRYRQRRHRGARIHVLQVDLEQARIRPFGLAPDHEDSSGSLFTRPMTVAGMATLPPARLGEAAPTEGRRIVAAVNGGFFSVDDEVLAPQRVWRPVTRLETEDRRHVVVASAQSARRRALLEKRGALVVAERGRRLEIVQGSHPWSRGVERLQGAGFLLPPLPGADPAAWLTQTLRDERPPEADVPTARTAVAMAAGNPRTVYLVTVEQPGLTLADLVAWLRRTLRVDRVLNLDGGGSAQMWVDRPPAPAGAGGAPDPAPGPAARAVLTAILVQAVPAGLQVDIGDDRPLFPGEVLRIRSKVRGGREPYRYAWRLGSTAVGREPALTLPTDGFTDKRVLELAVEDADGERGLSSIVLHPFHTWTRLAFKDSSGRFDLALTVPQFAHADGPPRIHVRKGPEIYGPKEIVQVLIPGLSKRARNWPIPYVMARLEVDPRVARTMIYRNRSLTDPTRRKLLGEDPGLPLLFDARSSIWVRTEPESGPYSLTLLEVLPAE